VVNRAIRAQPQGEEENSKASPKAHRQLPLPGVPPEHAKERGQIQEHPSKGWEEDALIVYYFTLYCKNICTMIR
jgi:hypothetical protein